MLSCSCNEYDGEGWYYIQQEYGFTILAGKRRKRCGSCKEFINIGAKCVEFPRYRSSISEIEERISGDEINLASWYMCEWCGEMYFNFDSLGYCIYLGDSMKENLKDYWEMTGFKPI